MEKRKKIVVLSGGFSEEREISGVTSAEVTKALESVGFVVEILDPVDFSSYPDLVTEIRQINPEIVFIGLHGAAGEDGRIQSLLSLENIPFTGSDYRASAIAIDKHISSALVSSLGIKIPKMLYFTREDKIDFENVIEKIGFPMVIKPNDSGSSVGISIIDKKEELEKATAFAFQFGKAIIIENFIDGRELTVTILGGKALPVVEIKPKNGWYDYQNKYTKGNTIYEVPAKLSETETKNIQTKAEQIFRLFGCTAYARIDFRYDGKDFFFLEVNTLPGMTPLSLTPMAAKEAGIGFPELLKKIIDLSLETKKI